MLILLHHPHPHHFAQLQHQQNLYTHHLLINMVQVSSPMLAAAACWLLASSGTLLVSGSPLGDSSPGGLAERFPEASKTTVIHWKGTLEEGKPEIELSGHSFQVRINASTYMSC